ncbi:hypothetical protein HY484_03755 [Candidatus Woesearchaeota archaeon]|nr:hypothetical protein [Candidatus Woesearchaeota archaeon]
MIDTNPDSLYSLATRYWNRLKEFVDNHGEASDYLLQRTQKEHQVLENSVDFNELYKKRFASFVMATHALIVEKLRHAPSSRGFFVTPTEESEKNDFLSGIHLEKHLNNVWMFKDDVPVKYVQSVNDIVRKLVFKNEWKKDYYTLEHIAKRYACTANDGMPFYIRKKLFEVHYRSYGDIKVRIIASKTFPDGPFKFFQKMLVDDEEMSDEERKSAFLAEQNLDAFIRTHKKALDERFDGLDAKTEE